jgi:hypothetical protein
MTHNASRVASLRRTGKRSLVIGLLLGASVSATGHDLKITTFDVPAAGKGPGQGTFAAGINLFGTIIGSYTDANNVSHSFLRRPDGRVTAFDPPGTASVPYPDFNGSAAIALNVAGEVGGYFVDRNLVVHAYLRSHDGKFTAYDWPGACTTSQNVGCHGSGVWNINDFGVAVGPFEDTSGNFVAHTAIRFPDGRIRTFEVPGSSMLAGQGTVPASFSGLNNFGAITGSWYDANNNFHGFLRSPGGTFTDFEAPGADTTDQFYGTTPASINDLGAITGNYLDASGVFHGFLRSPDGTYTTPLDAPGADLTPGNFNGTFPFNINLFGEITGLYSDVNGANHGFVRTRDGAFETLDAAGAGTGTSQGTVPLANNLFGAITGYYVDSNNVAHGFVAIPCFHECEDDAAAANAPSPMPNSLSPTPNSVRAAIGNPSPMLRSLGRQGLRSPSRAEQPPR